MRFFGRGALARVLVYAYLAPGTMLFIPLFMMMNNFGLRDNLIGLVLADLTFSVPFAAWLLMGYFRSIPIELEEAAMVDGASRVTALLRIVVAALRAGDRGRGGVCVHVVVERVPVRLRADSESSPG